jgi:formamidopyrimidine-DNA glycosylase
MPELPEVETVRRGVEHRVVGRTIRTATVDGARTVRRSGAEHVQGRLAGTRLTAAGRRGKYLLCPLDSGDVLLVHLRMSGQLRLMPAGSPRPRHCHVTLDLGDEELRFVDPRTFGEVVVVDPDRLAEQAPDLVRLGPDPLTDALGPDDLAGLLRTRRRSMKPLLADQHVIAGLGNIYTDEVLHAARVRPDRRSDTLSAREIDRLHGAIATVLAEAVAMGGSTLRDAQYVDLDGQPGSYQLHHRVYGRAGAPCRTCGRARVRRIPVGGRSAFVCLRCQR